MRKKTFRQSKREISMGKGRKTTTTSSGGAGAEDISTMPFAKRPIFHHLTRLQHGILRYKNIAESPTSVAQTEILDKDRKFVFIPEGYSAQNDKCLQEILVALGLRNLPPLVVVTASTNGAVEEHLLEDEDATQNGTGNPLETDYLNGMDLTEDEERELLREKTHDILKATIESCSTSGAWLLPHRPRMANGAAQILCDAIPPTKPPVIILGMIGLDKQDDNEGFTDLVVSKSYPVGESIKKVAELDYDPNVKDNTPCPELTHLLIFQRRKEMREFREKLLAHAPELFLAFGNTTDYAKKCMFANLVNGSPVALITHTSKAIDNMALALRYADREIQKVNVGAVDAPTSRIATHVVSGDEITFPALPLSPLPELEHDQELSSFLAVWPANYDDERIVLADPRRVGGEIFQQQMVRAIKAAFYLNRARLQALKEATALLKYIQDCTAEQKHLTEFYHIRMVLATLSAVVAAVFYAKIYGGAPAPSWNNRNPFQITLFVATIVIPVLILHLKKTLDRHMERWSKVQDDAAKLESAVFEFRSRPRSYGHSTSSLDPLEAFVATVRDIRLRNHGRTDNAYVSNSQVPVGTLPIETENRAEPPNETQDQEYDIEAPLIDESSPLIPAKSDSVPLQDIRKIAKMWKSYTDVDVSVLPVSDSDVDEQNSVSSLPLSIKDYIVCRIETEKKRKAGELVALEKRNLQISTTIKIILASSSLFALLSKQWFIPIVIGLTTTLASTQDFRKYTKRVEQSQSVISRLNGLLSWWQDLKVAEKVLSSNQDRLVQQAESIIMLDRSITF